MTSPDRPPVNVAFDGAQVGVQAGNAYIDSVTIPGDVQLTIGQDATPDAKYRVGVENLKSGNPRMARKLLWDAMMAGRGGNDVFFHWLVAMLSGRTVQQFGREEVGQLRLARLRWAEAVADAWADGIRLIYQLIDSALPQAGEKVAETDMPLLVKQVDSLGEEQRDMIRPHIDLFLTGPLKDEAWQRELRRARSGQHADDRTGRAWMYFQPFPARALLPMPVPQLLRLADRLAMRAGTGLFVAAAAYLGWQLLWRGAFLGLLSYAAALAGAAAATVAGLELRFLAAQRSRADEAFRERPASGTPGDELTDGIDKLFRRYFARYEPGKDERERLTAGVAGMRQQRRDEIVAMCRAQGIPANEVAWLIRYEVRQLRRQWQNGTLHEYRRQLLPRPGTVAALWIGLALLVIAGAWACVALRAHLLVVLAALASAFWAWQGRRRVRLEQRRYAADSHERARRQSAIDEEFERWSEKLQARPKDAEMAAWLGCDYTVLLGTALDHFHQLRSRLIAHAFLDEPGVAVRRARVDGGQWRYAGYRLLVFLLAEDGARQVRASLDFMTGTLVIRERTSYRYDAIVSARFSREGRRRTFELRLKAGEPITVHMRDIDPDAAQQQDKDARAAGETQDATEDVEPDSTSMADLLHALEGIAGEGRNWLRSRDSAGACGGDDRISLGEESV